MDLKAYFNGDSMNGLLYKTRFEKVKPAPAEPASEIEVEITLAKLTALLRRYDDALARFTQLAAAYPEQPAIHEASAHLHWRAGSREQAVEHFGRANKMGAPGWKTYRDYARLPGPDADLNAYGMPTSLHATDAPSRHQFSGHAALETDTERLQVLDHAELRSRVHFSSVWCSGNMRSGGLRI